MEAAKTSGETGQLLKIRSYLVDNKPLGFEECIVWARNQFEIEYNNEIRQLLFSLPKDLVSLYRFYSSRSFFFLADDFFVLSFFFFFF